MRATDIIRSVLDLLDNLDDREPKIDISIDGIPQEEPPEEPRFASVLKMLTDKRAGEYGNSPNEVVADVDAVTTLAGGGLNGPKHPADIRVKDPGYGHGG